MQIVHQTHNKPPKPARHAGDRGPIRRPLADWRPETSPLSREELRRIVLKELG